MVSTRRSVSGGALFCNAPSKALGDVRRNGSDLPPRRLDADVRELLVERPAHLHEPFEHGARIVAYEQRPHLRAPRAAHERVEIGLEVDDCARGGEVLAVRGVEDHATARGDDDVVEPREIGNDLALTNAKLGLAFLLEDVA